MPKEITYLEAIREALIEEMRRDPKVFVLGEDVGPYGGAFGVTQGLYDEFGELRVIDTAGARRCRSWSARRAAAASAGDSTTRRIRKRGSSIVPGSRLLRRQRH